MVVAVLLFEIVGSDRTVFEDVFNNDSGTLALHGVQRVFRGLREILRH